MRQPAPRLNVPDHEQYSRGEVSQFAFGATGLAVARRPPQPLLLLLTGFERIAHRPREGKEQAPWRRVDPAHHGSWESIQ
jgi:hypothetical protein